MVVGNTNGDAHDAPKGPQLLVCANPKAVGGDQTHLTRIVAKRKSRSKLCDGCRLSNTRWAEQRDDTTAGEQVVTGHANALGEYRDGFSPQRSAGRLCARARRRCLCASARLKPSPMSCLKTLAPSGCRRPKSPQASPESCRSRRPRSVFSSWSTATSSTLGASPAGWRERSTTSRVVGCFARRSVGFSRYARLSRAKRALQCVFEVDSGGELYTAVDLAVGKDDGVRPELLADQTNGMAHVCRHIAFYAHRSSSETRV